MTTPLKTVIYTAICVVVVLGSPFEQSFSISPHMFAALEDLNDSKDINRAWENIKESIKTPAKDSLVLHELKQHKPWFDVECLRFLYQRKQAKMQWLQHPDQSNADNT